MKLLLYIRNNDEKIELIPLSSKYLFSLTSDEKGQRLAYVVNQQYIPRFYGPKVNSFSVLVGDNGVGKTSLIRSIAKKSEEISSNRKATTDDCLIYEKDDQWYFTNEFSTVDNLLSTSSKIMNRETSKVKELKVHYRTNQRNGVTSYFYSPTLEVNQKTKFGSVVDCSTTKLLEQEKKGQQNENVYRQLVNSDMQRQIDFVVNYQKDVSRLLRIPKRLICKVEVKPQEFVGKLISFNSFSARIKNSLIFKNYEKIWVEVERDYLDNKETTHEKLTDNWKIQVETFFIRNLLKIYPIEAVIHDNLSAYSKSKELSQLVDVYKELMQFLKTHLNEEVWPDELEEDQSFSKSVNVSLDDGFINAYFKELSGFTKYGLADMFTFSWDGVSSGENALLNLFSRFSMNSESVEETVLLFIDEIDLGFHPKWQQQLIDMMLLIFPRLFKGTIQIVMTTHSPLLLSNFCQKDVILLTKDVDGERLILENDILTLGANMHKLLANNFFLKNALMGEFAKKRINEYFNFVIDQKGDFDREVDYQKHPEYLVSILTEIGEPVLRSKAIEEFKNYQSISIGTTELIYQEIQSLKSEIKQLKEGKFYEKD